MSDIQTIVLSSLIALGIGAHYLSKSNIKEHFAGNLPSFTVKAQRVAQTPDGFAEVSGNYQSILSPRMSNVDYGSHIRYNQPELKHMGVNPVSPISYKNLVTPAQSVCNQNQIEGYASCGAKGGLKSSNMQASGLNTPVSSYTETADLLPVQNMGSGPLLNALGEEASQPIIYDRYIYANQKSRLFAEGDPIRGDLPIVSQATGWFRPSVAPNVDLRNGALAVMGGLDNSTSKELLALQNASAGGLLDTGSGINYSVQKQIGTSAAGGDIRVTSFP
jgi:hypothetical protein